MNKAFTQKNMRRLIVALASFAALSVLLSSSYALRSGKKTGAVRTRIDPAGIKGSLVLCGEDGIPEKAMDRYLSLAGGKKARIVLVDAGLGKSDSASPALELLQKQWTDRKIASLTLLRISNNDQANDVTLLSPTTTATGVWISAARAEDAGKLLQGTALAKACVALVDRGSTLGASEQATLYLASRLVDNSTNETAKGMALLPDSLFGMISAKQDSVNEIQNTLKKHPGLVGYSFGPDSALIVKGRMVLAVGSDPVTIHLPAGSVRPAKKLVLKGKRAFADLTALRRSVRIRMSDPFPPKNPEPPIVKKGTLIIIGGGGMPKGLIQQFAELAGGPKASIVVFPTAGPDPIPEKNFMASALKKAGVKKVTVLPGRKLSEVDSPEYLNALKEATGIWFGGGRQWRFVDAYLDTKAHELMHEVLARGGVIAGSSAGASIQAEYMARGDPLGNLNIIADGYEKGLGFLKGAAVDQHFSQRKRQKDMSLLIKTYPQILGIGIDEATAIIVKGHQAGVVGRGKVYFYDAGRDVKVGQPDYQTLAKGGVYDLKDRRILEDGDSK